MTSPIISVEGLSKSYTISHQAGSNGRAGGYRRLSEELLSYPRQLFSRLTPNALRPSSTEEEFWALKDVSFEVNEGEVVGIIGRNGAGKSTLLKILSRITEPTSGRVTLRGRVASLLEVGTGFHPELTGRENIFLNGAILGMSRAEIKRKFDEIVEFAGVAKFLDTPVKRYSSGMYVRLAFAVAAHLDPEILVVDEVLAVGDAEFQKKCLGKMTDVASSGRTILFVSHNMAAIQSLCETCLFLELGQLRSVGPSAQIIDQYLTRSRSALRHNWEKTDLNTLMEVALLQARIWNRPACDRESELDGSLPIEVSCQARFQNPLKSVAIEMFVYTLTGTLLFCSFTEAREYTAGTHRVSFLIPAYIFNDGSHSISIRISRDYSVFVVNEDDILQFEVKHKVLQLGWSGSTPGIVRPDVKWEIASEC